MDNRLYNFQEHRGLTSGALFLYIALDETRKCLGLDDLTAAASWFLGQNNVPVSGKMKTATEGTSVISIFMRQIIKKQSPVRLPTITWATIRSLRFAYTKSLAAFVGRAIPVAGGIFMAYDVSIIIVRTIKTYNAVVSQEDRL
jgi:hypothetical protein